LDARTGRSLITRPGRQHQDEISRVNERTMARTTLASDDSSGNPLSLRELERQVLATRAEAERAGNNSAELDQLGHRKFELNRQTHGKTDQLHDDAVVQAPSALAQVRRQPTAARLTTK
jgi:hypothetical protein